MERIEPRFPVWFALTFSPIMTRLQPEKLEPSSNVDRKLKTDPQRAIFFMERPLPLLKKPRTDRELPKKALCKIEACPCIFNALVMLAPDPTLNLLRILKPEPALTKSRTDA
jgi:hypothetical protein